MVQNARNLMTVVLKAMTAAEAVCVKVGIYQFIIYVCPLTSSKPIISPPTEHTKCIPLSTTIKHTNYTTIHYYRTYQWYPQPLIKPIIPYSLHSNIPIISTTIEHTNYTTIHYPWTYQFIHYHRTHRLPLNIPSITGGRGLNIERFVVHMSTVMWWKSSRYWTIFLLC